MFPISKIVICVNSLECCVLFLIQPAEPYNENWDNDNRQPPPYSTVSGGAGASGSIGPITKEDHERATRTSNPQVSSSDVQMANDANGQDANAQDACRASVIPLPYKSSHSTQASNPFEVKISVRSMEKVTFPRETEYRSQRYFGANKKTSRFQKLCIKLFKYIFLLDLFFLN